MKYSFLLLRLLARRSFTFALFLFFSVSEVGAALMGDSAEHCRFEPNIYSQFSSRISYQNTYFNMYTTSKQQEGSRDKDSQPKYFITTNFFEFHRQRAVNRSVLFPLKFLNIDRTHIHYRLLTLVVKSSITWSLVDRLKSLS